MKVLKPTPEILNSLSELLQLQELEKKAIEKYQPIDERVFKKYTMISEFTGEVITDIDKDFECKDEDMLHAYCKELHDEYVKAGSKLDGDKDPVPTVQYDVLKKKHEFMKHCLIWLQEYNEDYKDITFDMLLRKLDTYNKMFELLKQLFTPLLPKSMELAPEVKQRMDQIL